LNSSPFSFFSNRKQQVFTESQDQGSVNSRQGQWLGKTLKYNNKLLKSGKSPRSTKFSERTECSDWFFGLII